MEKSVRMKWAENRPNYPWGRLEMHKKFWMEREDTTSEQQEYMDNTETEIG
jgi:hypothetical protein